jgi:chromosome partitioning protein
MEIVAVIAQKGGAGKTTLAVNLAVAAELDGRAAAIIDLDPQSTASSWGDRREGAAPVVLSAQPARLEPMLAGARRGGADLVLLDTPPHAERAALAAAKVASLVLVPCRPAIFDLETVATTLDLLRYAGTPALGILNAVPWRGARGAQAGAVLTDLGLAVCPSVLCQRVAFEHAVARALGVQEHQPRGKAAAEMQHVYTSVCEALTR